MTVDVWKGYVKAVNWTKYGIIVVWVVMMGIGGWQVSTLFNNLEDNLTPPSDSRSTHANNAWGSGGFCYPDKAVLLVETVDGSDIRNVQTETLLNATRPVFYHTMDYIDAQVHGATLAMPLFINPEKTATIQVIPGGYSDDVVDTFNSIISSSGFAEQLPNLRWYITGPSAMDDTTSDAASSDLARADGVSIPIALLFLAWRVRSLPLLVIPVLCLVSTLLSAFAILAAMSSHVAFPSFSPSLFISTGIAMSFDWALFLLTRYGDASKGGLGPVDAVVATMRSSGHAVVVSGLCLCISYVAMLSFPIDFLSATGKGAAVTLAMCLIVTMTLTPALLLSFPTFFRLDTVSFVTCRRQRGCGCCCRPPRDGAVVDGGSLRYRTPSSDPMYDALVGAGPSDGGAGIDKSPAATAGPHHAPKDTAWFRLTTFVVDHPWIVLAVVLCASAPFMYFASWLRITSDTNQLYPKNTDVYHAFQRYKELFPAGWAKPYALVAIPTNSVINHDLEGYILVEQHNALVQRIIDATGISPQNVIGPTWVNGAPRDVNTTLAYLTPALNPALYNSPEGALSRYLQSRCNKLSPDDLPYQKPTMFYTELVTPFDPQGKYVAHFVKTVRDEIDAAADPEYSQFYIALGIAYMVDVVDSVYAVFYIVVLATLGILLVLVAAFFRSVVTGVRLIFTLGLTLALCFGGTSLVFESGLFFAHESRLYWMSLVLTTSLVLALGVDYDVFLMTRIAELRGEGLSTRAAIVQGSSTAGPTITTAGIIMVVAFGSLMSSSQQLLREAGFIIAWSVFLDTFVVRTLVVPAAMSLLGDANWWPGTTGKRSASFNAAHSQTPYFGVGDGGDGGGGGGGGGGGSKGTGAYSDDRDDLVQGYSLPAYHSEQR